MSTLRFFSYYLCIPLFFGFVIIYYNYTMIALHQCFFSQPDQRLFWVFTGFQGGAEAESRAKDEAAVIHHRDKGSQRTRSPNIMKQTSLYSWLLSICLIVSSQTFTFHLICFQSNVLLFVLQYQCIGNKISKKSLF